MLMVLAQPDLGTALTYVPIAVMGVFLGGLQWKQGMVVALLAAMGSGAVFFTPRVHVLKTYQKQRLTSFIDPELDPQGSGYQVEQSKIAVGSGGLWGGKGSQTHGAFLPVPQTDFIFAAFSEEHGFVGALGVLLLYFIVLMRLTQNAQTAPDRAGTFVVMGVVAVLSFHILVNVGMGAGFMPVTGIPLPLMSYGGSSVLLVLLSYVILLNVGMVFCLLPVAGSPLPLMSYGGSSVLFMFLALGMVMNVRMRRFLDLSGWRGYERDLLLVFCT